MNVSKVLSTSGVIALWLSHLLSQAFKLLTSKSESPQGMNKSIPATYSPFFTGLSFYDTIDSYSMLSTILYPGTDFECFAKAYLFKTSVMFESSAHPFLISLSGE